MCIDKRKGENKMTRDLNGMTVGELKTILENVPNETPIYIWGTEVDYIEIEVNIYPKEMNIETDVFINVEVVSPY